jgi:hypothetical protein
LSETVPFFYGLQPRWLTGDRLYRVYVSDKALVGAYVAGQFHDEESAATQLQQAWILARPLVRRWLAQRRERERFYNSLDPFGPELLHHDSRNFRIDKTDVVRSRFRRNRSLWTPFNVGSVEFELLDSTRRRFILVGDQEQELVLRLVQQFDPAAIVTGEPNSLRRRQQMTPEGKRRFYSLLGTFFSTFGAFCVYVAVAGMAPMLVHIPLAVINVAVGSWCYWNAWRVPQDLADPVDFERAGT